MASPRRTLLVISTVLAAGLMHAAEAPAKQVEKFLSRYCAECHDAATHKGDRSFDKFTLPLKTLPAVIEAREIIDQLTLRDCRRRRPTSPATTSASP